MTYVIIEVRREGSGWYTRYEDLPSSTYSGTPRIFIGTTQYQNLSAIIPIGYIFKDIWDSLDLSIKQDAATKVVAIVDSTWLNARTVYPPGAQRYYVREFNPESIIEGYKETTLVPHDPCDGVICEPECAGVDLVETRCEEGVCVRGATLETDSETCGYIPPEPEPPIDPCAGVVCDPMCVGDDLHENACDEGICVRGRLLEADSIQCGYMPPEPEPEEPEPEPEPDDKKSYVALVAAGLLGLYLFLRR